MFSSLISSKTPPTSNHKKINLVKKTKSKKVNILRLTRENISQVLEYLRLDQILKLYRVSRNGISCGEIQNRIIIYLTLSVRKFKSSEQKLFLWELVGKVSGFGFQNFGNQNQFWKESILLDVERTHPNQLLSSKTSERSLLTDRSFSRKNENPPAQKNVGSHLFLTNLNCNFHIFHSSKHRKDSEDLRNHLRRKTDSSYRLEDSQLKFFMSRVLNAISNKHKDIGYVQGLNYWVRHLFENKFSEEEAFDYICFLLQRMQAKKLFQDQMLKVRQMVYVFEIYLFNNLPKVYQHLKQNEVPGLVYATNWFITLFAQQLPKHIINKLWHLFILKGWKILVKFSVAVLCCFSQEIKQVKRDELLPFMRNILLRITQEKQERIWIVMTSIKVSNKMIKYLSRQMVLLSNDTQIQLWRLQQERVQLQKNKYNKMTSFLLFCRPQLVREKSWGNLNRYFPANRLQEENLGGFCCSKIEQRPENETNGSSQNKGYNLLSFCSSVEHK